VVLPSLLQSGRVEAGPHQRVLRLLVADLRHFRQRIRNGLADRRVGRLAELCAVLGDEAVVLRPTCVGVVLTEVVVVVGDRDDRAVASLVVAVGRNFLARRGGAVPEPNPVRYWISEALKPHHRPLVV
jgi:hypothetical protein